MNATDAMLLDSLRKKLISRGARGIMGLGRLFKIFDDDGDNLLEPLEFKKAMGDMRVGFNDKEIERLYKVFDRD